MGKIKTILLTGATGYLGSKLIGALVAAKYNVIILKRSSSDIKRIKSIRGDFGCYNVDNYEKAFEENDIDCVLHTAASYGRLGETLSDIYLANLVFPVGLLDSCIKHGVKYFVNTATCLPETLNAYSLSKAQFKAVLNLKKDALRILNIELQYFYGPNEDNSKFIGFILDKIFSGASSIDLTDGTQFRDFIFIDDVIDAYLLLLHNIVNQKTQFVTVPVGYGEAYTLRSIVEKIKKYTKSDIQLNFGALPMRNGEIMYAKADIQVLQDLGWQPKYDIDEGLTQIINIQKHYSNDTN